MLCAGFSLRYVWAFVCAVLCYVRDSYCVLFGIHFVLCVGFSLFSCAKLSQCQMRDLVCVACWIESVLCAGSSVYYVHFAVMNLAASP